MEPIFDLQKLYFKSISADTTGRHKKRRNLFQLTSFLLALRRKHQVMTQHRITRFLALRRRRPPYPPPPPSVSSVGGWYKRDPPRGKSSHTAPTSTIVFADAGTHPFYLGPRSTGSSAEWFILHLSLPPYIRAIPFH